MNNTKNRLCTLAALLLGVLVLAAPKAAAQGFAAGTALCLQSVLPALFPFFVVCELLTAAAPPDALLRPMQRVLGLASPDTAQAVLLSWVGGYAVCARLTGQLYSGERIPRQDAVRLQILGCCSGPGFVIGCVGGLLLGNVRLGVVLYAAQIGANLAAGVVCLFRLCGRASFGQCAAGRGDVHGTACGQPWRGGAAAPCRGGCLPAARRARAASGTARHSCPGWGHPSRRDFRCGDLLTVCLWVRGVFPACRGCSMPGAAPACGGCQRCAGNFRRVR